MDFIIFQVSFLNQASSSKGFRRWSGAVPICRPFLLSLSSSKVASPAASDDPRAMPVRRHDRPELNAASHIFRVRLPARPWNVAHPFSPAPCRAHPKKEPPGTGLEAHSLRLSNGLHAHACISIRGSGRLRGDIPPACWWRPISGRWQLQLHLHRRSGRK